MMNDELPSWLTTTETAREVLFWMMRQPDRTRHELQLLFENAELPEHYRESVLRLRPALT
jgi:hypothetical protein